MSKRNILVVDDNLINRKILVGILKSDYTVFESENGKQAIEFLQTTKEFISLILLDIVMPVMNGYEFMETIKDSANLNSIPIIVETSSGDVEDELRCLSAGATDFITKPYNGEIVKHRISSIIRLCESSAMLNNLEYDKLTGFHAKEFFFQRVAQTLNDNPMDKYDIICSNIENFKLINERHGVKKGDELLRYIADKYRQIKSDETIGGYLGADKFFALSKHKESYDEEFFDAIATDIYYNAPVRHIVIKFAVYQDVDKALPIPSMCDRAIAAMDRIKRVYGKSIASYDDSLHVELLREQTLVDAMEEGITKKQFVVYYQPKYDIQDNVIIGMEALVRWQHPKYGMILPGEFIPLFEKNGFIAKLDFYVWEQALIVLKRWQTNKMTMFPISVNVSRIDFSINNLPQKLNDMVCKYGIDTSFLHLEITESVYTDNPDEIIKTVKELRAMGFKIEMDDFGSSYSSLSMFSLLPIDVLKLDIGFIKSDSLMQTKSVMSFIISLAKWLEIATIAEGVETKEQVDNLLLMGCHQVQGYYYARPMPLDKLEQHIQDTLSKVETNTEMVVAEEDELFTNAITGTVLVADDIEINREILKKMLEPSCQVVEASNGKEVIEYLRLHPKEVDAVILDLLMPVMDGFKTLEIMKSQEEFSKIPVLITSELGVDNGVRSLRLGADGLIYKPFQTECVLHSVKSAIDCAKFQQMVANGSDIK